VRKCCGKDQTFQTFSRNELNNSRRYKNAGCDSIKDRLSGKQCSAFG
jgi:hypothetical protein